MEGLDNLNNLKYLNLQHASITKVENYRGLKGIIAILWDRKDIHTPENKKALKILGGLMRTNRMIQIQNAGKKKKKKRVKRW